MPLRNPFSKQKLTDEEFAQLEALQRFYLQDIADDSKELHEYLQATDDERVPRYSSTSTDLERSMFQGRLGGGLLSMESENILVNVLQYQRSRTERASFTSGYANDPRNLLCEVIKKFVVDTLSWADLNPDLLALIDKWSKFIHHITMANVFRPGGSSKETMEAMLVSVRNSLRYQVRPTLVKQLNTSSAREHIYWFIQSAKRVLSHGTQFLYFVLRNTQDTPRNCTIPNIQIGQKPLDRVLKTYSGRLLQAMVLSTPFRQVFPLGYIPGGLSEVASQLLEASISTFSTDGTSGKVIVPPLLAQIVFSEKEENVRQQDPGGLFKKKKKEVPVESQMIMREMFPHIFLSGIESGIAKPFREKRELLEEFVKLHELFIKIASLIHLLEQAHSLAGEGGDLLVYGLSRKHVAGLVVDYTLLSNAVRDSITIIEQHADGLYQHLVRENQPLQLHWKQNYLQVSHVSMLLSDDLESCHVAAYRVRQQATTYSLTMKNRLDRLKGNLENFIDEAAAFSRSLRSVLKLPGAAQADELLDAELPKISMENCLSIQFNSLSDMEEITELTGSGIRPRSEIKEPYMQRQESAEAIRKPVEVKPPDNTPPPESSLRSIPVLSKIKAKTPKSKIVIVSISPGVQPLSGDQTKIYGNGFHEDIKVRVGNKQVDNFYLQKDGDRQLIVLRSPTFSSPGEVQVVLTNPDSGYAIGSLVYANFDDDDEYYE